MSGAMEVVDHDRGLQTQWEHQVSGSSIERSAVGMRV